MIEVTLTTYEIFMAASIGVARRLSSLKKEDSPTTNKVNNKDFGWHSDIEGACAEIAFAKATGNYWSGSEGGKGRSDVFKAPDVGEIQIRHTQHKGGCLIVREPDADDEIFVLVTGTSPNFIVRGWKMGKSAKNDRYWTQKGEMSPAWFVPQNELSSTDELLEAMNDG